MKRISLTLMLLLLCAGLPLLASSQAEAGSQRFLFGINEDWQNHPPNRVALADRVGAKAIRFPLSWGRIQPRRGMAPTEWNWGVYDKLYRQARRRGMKPILVPQAAPAWARPSTPPGAPGSWRPDPEFLEDYGLFVTAALTRYPETAAVEAWNEPNLSPFYSPRPNPAEYAGVLCAVHEAVDERPGVAVLLGGMAFIKRTDPGRAIPYDRFLRRVNELGGKPCYDAVGFHFFSKLGKARKALRKIRRELAYAGVAKRGIWVTEAGRSSAKGSEREQARELRRLHRQLKRIRYVKAVIVHKMFDERKGGNRRFRTMGLVDLRGRKKPAFRMFARSVGRR